MKLRKNTNKERKKLNIFFTLCLFLLLQKSGGFMRKKMCSFLAKKVKHSKKTPKPTLYPIKGEVYLPLVHSKSFFSSQKCFITTSPTTIFQKIFGQIEQDFLKTLAEIDGFRTPFHSAFSLVFIQTSNNLLAKVQEICHSIFANFKQKTNRLALPAHILFVI